MTGNSLGGAVAKLLSLLLAEIYGPIVDRYTFGSPRVGDNQFKTIYDSKVKQTRFVNGNDIVTTIPVNDNYNDNLKSLTGLSIPWIFRLPRLVLFGAPKKKPYVHVGRRINLQSGYSADGQHLIAERHAIENHNINYYQDEISSMIPGSPMA